MPIVRDKLPVGRLSAYREPAPDDVGEALASISDVLSLAVSNAESSATASRRSSQASVVQLASEALSRTLDEGQVYRTVLALAIELLDSRAGAVLDAGGRTGRIRGLREISGLRWRPCLALGIRAAQDGRTRWTEGTW